MQPLMSAAQAGFLGQANERAFRGVADDAVVPPLFSSLALLQMKAHSSKRRRVCQWEMRFQ